MGYNYELLTSQSNVFSGVQKSFEKAAYTILGVPFDVTSTYRSGARFAPNAIREASLNIETFSFRSNLDIEDLKIHDLGDLHVSSNVEYTMKKLELIISDLLEAEKIPVTMGGEHTITFGIFNGILKKNPETVILSFDAHLDLRDEFMGLKLSHATFMRRINEKLKPAKIIEVGTRAVCKEELTYAKKAGITFFTTQQIRKETSEQIIKQLKKELLEYDKIYLTIDLDVTDPAYVPAVQNPESDGLEIYILLDLLCNICDERIIAFDIVELSPHYDSGISAVQAAKILFELLCQLEKSRQN